MSPEKLKSNLNALHEEITRTETENPEEQKKLSTLTDNIQNVLGDPGDVSFGHHRNLMHGLNDALESFEVSHPTLTTLINNVISSLNALGI